MNINRVVLTGNLTRDPETREAGSSSVTQLGLAVNGRKKDSSGEWVEVPNYFNVSVWGTQGENCARFLSKGSAVAIDGRLQYRSWEKDGQKRSAVDVVADSVQFLGGRSDRPEEPAQASLVGDEDIPF